MQRHSCYVSRMCILEANGRDRKEAIIQTKELFCSLSTEMLNKEATRNIDVIRMPLGGEEREYTAKKLVAIKVIWSVIFSLVFFLFSFFLFPILTKDFYHFHLLLSSAL